MKRIEIKHHKTNAVLFSHEAEDNTMAITLRMAIDAQIVLIDADLSDANLIDASLSATPEQSIENLDKVRTIILDDKDRLEMRIWHGDDEWVDRTCAEETICGTTHCLAGWLQVCSTDPEIRKMSPNLAGILSAPIASKMFFRGETEVLEWLENRAYVEELAKEVTA